MSTVVFMAVILSPSCPGSVFGRSSWAHEYYGRDELDRELEEIDERLYEIPPGDLGPPWLGNGRQDSHVPSSFSTRSSMR